jgi:DNA-binding transcriptional MerR regulator
MYSAKSDSRDSPAGRVWIAEGDNLFPSLTLPNLGRRASGRAGWEATMTATGSGAAPAGMTMTIGELARRSGTSVKVLRRYEGMGLISTVGRSPAGYRLFDRDALWCVGVIQGLRSLGLTVAEVRHLAGVYLNRPDQPIGPHLAERLREVRLRLDARIAELQQVRQRLDDFQASHQAELTGHSGADFREGDPKFNLRSSVRTAAAGA